MKKARFYRAICNVAFGVCLGLVALLCVYSLDLFDWLEFCGWTFATSCLVAAGAHLLSINAANP